MSDEGVSKADSDLLARLNALKKTHIDLDDKKYKIPVTAHVQPPIDPSPARTLHADLTARFKSLTGNNTSEPDDGVGAQDKDGNAVLEEDSKTIEELLAELGGEGAWNVEKDEATQIDDLLRSAKVALKDAQPVDKAEQEDSQKPGNTYVHDLPNLDVQFSQPDPDLEEDLVSDDEGSRKTKRELEAEIDSEADAMIAKLKDELKNAPPEPDSEDEEGKEEAKQSTEPNLPTAPSFDLPTIPSTEPTSTADNDLAARFASLSLPRSSPTTLLPSAPSSKPGSSARYGTSTKHTGHTNEEIDSWCIICLEDATLRCIGCDGDLYCAKCWIEGHRGPDAGYDERKHKAVEYNRGVKKEPKRRIAA